MPYVHHIRHYVPKINLTALSLSVFSHFSSACYNMHGDDEPTHNKISHSFLITCRKLALTQRVFLLIRCALCSMCTCISILALPCLLMSRGCLSLHNCCIQFLLNINTSSRFIFVTFLIILELCLQAKQCYISLGLSVMSISGQLWLF